MKDIHNIPVEDLHDRPSPAEKEIRMQEAVEPPPKNKNQQEVLQ